MKKGWLYGLAFGLIWIACKMIAYNFHFLLNEIQPFVLLNMALLTTAIALFMYRKKRFSTSESNILTDIKSGLSAGLPYTLLVSFFLFFYYRDIYPEFNQNKRAAYERRMDSPEEIAAIRLGNSALENKSARVTIRATLGARTTTCRLHNVCARDSYQSVQCMRKTMYVLHIVLVLLTDLLCTRFM